MALYCASSSYRVAALSPTSCSRNTQRNIPLSRMTTQTAGSSSFLATAAAAVLLCSSLFAPSALAADFAAPGSVDLQPPPSRAEGLARSRTAAPSPPPPPPTVELLSGSVRVSDGDTVEITSEADGTRHMVRIWGIDAPETKQLCRDGAGRDYACGKKATERMRELLGETATCEIRARDQYGRAVARCFPGSRTEEDIISEGEGGMVQRRAELDELYNSVFHGAPLWHNGRWGMATLEVCLAIVESARTRSEVRLHRQVPMPDAYDADLKVEL